MARPKNKTDLITQSQSNFDKLFDFVDGFSEAEQEKDFPEGTLNRNIRDVLAHLHHWNLMFLDWYSVGMAGQQPKMPAENHTWKTLPDLNREIQVKYSKTDLGEAKKLLRASFRKVFAIIKKHADEELFTKKKYHWTGSTSLGAYLVSASSSHYDWAYKLIKRVKK